MLERRRILSQARSATLTSIALSLGVFWLAASATAKHQQVALTTPAEAISLSPLDVHPRISLTIVEQLRHAHYLKKSLDDQASSQIFEKYLGMLDGSKVYFTSADMAAVEKYRYVLDDALIRGDLQPAFMIFNRYQDRLRNRLEFLLGELESGLDKLDFEADEYIEIDRENAPWAADEVALDALWRKRLKAAVLSMKLNGKELDEVETLLKKRYSNRLKQSKQTKSEDAFQLYVNAFA
ncbi:MAG: tail-specific protease, partial [Pseudomonadales bacterium]